MPSLTIVTGAPGTGKTTVAALLAEASAVGVHIPSDLFYSFPAHPIPPHLPASHEQNVTIITAMTRAAIAFATRGYDVYLEGIIGPWFLPPVLTELRAAQIIAAYVVLRAPLETTRLRTEQRNDGSDQAVVRQMHAAFEPLGAYAAHAIDTTARTPAEIADEITRRTRTGELTLAPA